MSFCEKTATTLNPGLWKSASSDKTFPPKKGAFPFAPSKRKIPKNHNYDPKALKHMARMLWAMSVSLGHALTAYRQFTKLKSVTVSPDGLLGGHGYVMSVKDIRQKLYEACEDLSAISDTIHDEINGPHWQPKLSQLDDSDAQDIERFMQESQKFLENPEEEAEEDMEAVESQPFKKKKPSTEDSFSKIPSAAETREDNHFYDSQDTYRNKQANSSLPVDSVPGGPRVDHLGPGENGLGLFDSYNKDEPPGNDDWSDTQGVGNTYLYPTPWARDFNRSASSNIPDSATDDTTTDADDFGIGYGAKGEGSKGYGPINPETGEYGTNGPFAGLPHDLGGKTKDNEYSDTTGQIELSLNENRNKWAAATLPNDYERPVARSDYYKGPKGNTIAMDPEMLVGESEMPGEGDASYTYDRGLLDTGATYERQDTPYIKWDDSTHNYRQDIFQRGPA